MASGSSTVMRWLIPVTLAAVIAVAIFYAIGGDLIRGVALAGVAAAFIVLHERNVRRSRLSAGLSRKRRFGIASFWLVLAALTVVAGLVFWQTFSWGWALAIVSIIVGVACLVFAFLTAFFDLHAQARNRAQ